MTEKQQQIREWTVHAATNRVVANNQTASGYSKVMLEVIILILVKTQSFCRRSSPPAGGH